MNIDGKTFAILILAGTLVVCLIGFAVAAMEERNEARKSTSASVKSMS